MYVRWRERERESNVTSPGGYNTYPCSAEDDEDEFNPSEVALAPLLSGEIISVEDASISEFRQWMGGFKKKVAME
jgi:hypothetical protein